MKLVARTRSVVPLVLSIIGGVFGILSGLCYGVLFDAVNKAADAAGASGLDVNLSLLSVAGYILLFVSIIAVVAGAMARSQRFGSFLLFIMGLISIVCMVMMWIAAKAFPGIMVLVPVILFVTGGIVGMVMPRDEEIHAPADPAGTNNQSYRNF